MILNYSFRDTERSISSREVEKALHRETNSPLNRLKSIYHDSQFVESISSHFPNLPLVANERCGRWYIPTTRCHSSAYFKSTDGHYGNWSFSTRRLNLDFLGTIVAHGGAILVDSTRRGKRMPDALSKTVPIWCSVINRCASEDKQWTETHLPSVCVSPQEASSIEALIPMFVRSLKDCGFDISSISQGLDKPLRPVFITPESEPDFQLPDECYPIILLTASSLVPGRHIPDRRFVYVQGAADDEEAWSHELTSIQFWENYEKLLQCTQEDELVDVIQRIVDNCIPTQMMAEVSPIASTGISLGIGGSLPGTTTINCRLEESLPSKDSQSLSLCLPVKSKPYVELTRKIFPTAVTFAHEHGILTNTQMSIVAIDTSRATLDLSIAITLVLLCLFFDDQGNVIDRRGETMTKDIIRTRLVWIITARGQQAERVSRQTLKIVNTYLMSRPPQNVVSNVQH